MSERSSQRWVQAFATLALVERSSPALPTTRRMRRVVTDGSVAHLLDGVDDPTPTGGTQRRLRAPLSADTVRIGKFDHGRQVRLRGFYDAAGLTVRVQAGRRDGSTSHGVARSVTAARVVGAHRPDLVPRMVDDGTMLGGRTAFLAEETVTGRPPRNAPEVIAALSSVATDLGAVQQAVGIDALPLSTAAHPQLLERWRAVVADRQVTPALGAAVDRLIARDALLEVSFTHGDLVSSNVLRSPGRVVLIDWEYAGTQPIAFDLAKMHINAGSPGPAVEALDGALGRRVGHRRGHYSLTEQLALAHAVVLSRHQARSVRARRAGRVDALERQTRKRALALRELLALTD